MAVFTVILLAVLFLIGVPAAYAMIFACIPYFMATGAMPMDMIGTLTLQKNALPNLRNP